MQCACGMTSPNFKRPFYQTDPSARVSNTRMKSVASRTAARKVRHSERQRRIPAFRFAETRKCVDSSLALSRKTPFAVIPAKAGIQAWTPAYAGVTERRLFITFGGPQAHEDLRMTGPQIWVTTSNAMYESKSRWRWTGSAESLNGFWPHGTVSVRPHLLLLPRVFAIPLRGLLPSAGLAASASRLQIFEAQYPAHPFPCLRFAEHLAMPSAKLGVEWIATPFWRGIFILCFLPVYPGAFQTPLSRVCARDPGKGRATPL